MLCGGVKSLILRTFIILDKMALNVLYYTELRKFLVLIKQPKKFGVSIRTGNNSQVLTQGEIMKFFVNGYRPCTGRSDTRCNTFGPFDTEAEAVKKFSSLKEEAIKDAKNTLECFREEDEREHRDYYRGTIISRLVDEEYAKRYEVISSTGQILHSCTWCV